MSSKVNPIDMQEERERLEDEQVAQNVVVCGCGV